MRRGSITIITAALSATAAAQCGMTVSGFSAINCGGGFVDVNTTGGTAPYTITVRKTPQNVLLGTFSDADGDMSVPAGAPDWWYNTGGAYVTVTDAVNCVATMNVSHAAFQASWTTPGAPALDCASGNFRVTMSAPTGSWPNLFKVDNGAVQNTTGNWSLVSGTTYSLNAVLTPGAHGITFPEQIVSGITACAITHNVTVPAPVTPGDCGANLSIRAALQGALPSGTLMGDSLRVHGLLPLAEPYSALGYSYAGMNPGASTTQALLNVTGSNAIVDWVIVELRNSANAAQVLFSRPALLQRDGDVMDLDGDSYVNFPSASGSYYVALRHRNHLGVMTASAIALSASPTTANFQSASTGCYGTSPRAQVGSVYCLWCGDATGNGAIKYTGSGNDRDPILIAVGGITPNATVPNVYDRRDTNLDGVIKYTGSGNDRDVILTNVGSTTPNNTRTQQLP